MEYVEIPQWLKFKTPPYEHQRSMLRFHKSQPYSAEWGDFGVGKSKVGIDLIRWRLRDREIKRGIIMCPACVLQSWEKELETHSDLDYSIGEISPSSEVSVLSYDGLGYQKKGKGKNATYDMNDRMLQAMSFAKQDGGTQLILDESTKVKNPNAKRTVCAHALSDLCDYRVIMSGIPVPNNLMDIWSQIRVMDGGKMLGRNFYAFRHKYFRKPPWLPFVKWEPYADTQDRLTRVIYRHGIRFLREECLDLPDAIYSVRRVNLTPEQRRMMSMLEGPGMLRFDEYPAINTSNPLTQFTKQYEVANGFLYFDKERKHVHTFKKNPKNTLAREILDEWLQGGAKAVVYTAFVEQKNTMLDLLEGYRPTDKMQPFQEDEGRKVFLDHVSQGVGVTLHRANFTMYLSNTFNLEDRVQSEARIRRAGQTKKQYYVDILAADCPVEDRVYACLRDKREIHKEVMRDVK